MGEIDISAIPVGELRTVTEAARELGVTKGRVTQYMGKGQLDYGWRGEQGDGGVKLIPESEVQRRKRENPGPGNPNFGKKRNR